jgi:hypothetical protein
MLALVSCRFGRLTRASLYSQVQLSLSSEKYVSFTRSLSKLPELSSCVWKAQLIRRLYHDVECAKEEIYRRAQQLLQILPALRALDLGNFSCSDELTSLFDIPMSNLRYLSFYNDKSQYCIHELTKAFSFPQIRRLSILRNDGFMRENDTWIRQYIALVRSSQDVFVGTSSLKELDLRWSTDWFVLNTGLVKVPLALEKLSCQFQYSGRFSPKETVVALRPLYSTLVSLNLRYSAYGEDVKGPVADFSSFVLLKNLTVDDALCFQVWSNDRPDEGCGFYSRLPFTLEMLQVSAGLTLVVGRWARLMS